MIYSGKPEPTKCLESIIIDTSKEISTEELRRMLNDLREAVMTNKSILLSDMREENDNE
jgi:hypothetical protein